MFAPLLFNDTTGEAEFQRVHHVGEVLSVVLAYE